MPNKSRSTDTTAILSGLHLTKSGRHLIGDPTDQEPPAYASPPTENLHTARTPCSARPAGAARLTRAAGSLGPAAGVATVRTPEPEAEAALEARRSPSGHGRRNLAGRVPWAAAGGGGVEACLVPGLHSRAASGRGRAGTAAALGLPRPRWAGTGRCVPTWARPRAWTRMAWNPQTGRHT